MDDFVDTTPTTLIFVASDRRVLVEDTYDEVMGRLTQSTHEPSPLIRVTVEGEEVGMLITESVIIMSGDRREDFKNWK